MAGRKRQIAGGVGGIRRWLVYTLGDAFGYILQCHRTRPSNLSTRIRCAEGEDSPSARGVDLFLVVVCEMRSSSLASPKATARRLGLPADRSPAHAAPAPPPGARPGRWPSCVPSPTALGHQTRRRSALRAKVVKTGVWHHKIIGVTENQM